MNETELQEMINLADGITARLTKASAMLAVLRSTNTSNFNPELIHEYAQAIQDFIDEARNMHTDLWKRIAKSS